MHTKPHHISGTLHVTGQSKFVFDELRPSGTQKMAVLFSEYAHAEIISLDISEAEKMPNITKVITYKDIPNENQIGEVIKDEPLLAENEVQYVGQPIALVVGENLKACKNALKAIRIEYREKEAIYSIEKALEANSVIGTPQKLEKGDIEKGFLQSDKIIEGEIIGGGQEHLYLETQRTRVVPDEDNHLFVYSATQAPTEVQHIVAHILGLESKDVTVDVKRLGGAFGGKERAATLWATLTALAAFTTKKPVEFALSRLEDLRYTGKRHPFEAHYKVGFSNEGRIQAADIQVYINGGAFADLSTAILERALWHIDNIYHIPNIKAFGKAARTNLPPNTAFRGFGGPQGIFIIERIIERIAFATQKDSLEIRKLNAYRENELTPFHQPVKEVIFDEIFEKLEQNADYKKLQDECNTFNSQNKFEKKGIGITPVKFGISFTTAFLNQGAALVWVYTDGSVSVSHGGIEMGQELNTKIAQIVAHEFGLSLDRIKIESTNTKRVANTSPTAASSGSDINGNAARMAAEQIKKRLISFAQEELESVFNTKTKQEDIVFENGFVFASEHLDQKFSFPDLVQKAYLNRINLGAQAYYKTPGIYFDKSKGRGEPFYYFVYGAALTQAKIDVLTGMYRFEKAYIIHENGQSLNPNIDLGQIEGAYIQGLGWCTMEEIRYNNKGHNITDTTSTYKIPALTDIPEVFETELITRKREFASVYGSKAVGEPPFVYGLSAYFALKNAVESTVDYRKECDLILPATPEAVLMEIEKLKK